MGMAAAGFAGLPARAADAPDALLTAEEQAWVVKHPVVLFAPERARYEREGRRDVTMLTDGSALAAVSYGSLRWLVPEILKHRGHAEVLDPPHVRESVLKAAKKLQRSFTRAPARS